MTFYFLSHTHTHTHARAQRYYVLWGHYIDMIFFPGLNCTVCSLFIEIFLHDCMIYEPYIIEQHLRQGVRNAR